MKRSLVIFICLMFGSIYANTVWENNLKVRSSASIEWEKASAPTENGGMLFVWSDVRGNDRDLYAQRVSMQGNPVWSAPRIIDNKTGIQRNPVLAKTSDGYFIIAWVDTHSRRNGDIHIQKINGDCQRLWQEGGTPVTNNDATKTELRLIPDAGGGVVITWTCQNDSTLYTCGQSYGAAGNRRWIESGVNLTNLDYYTATSVVSDGSNGILVAYSSDYDSLSRVYMNRFNADGNPMWANPVSIGDGTDMNRYGLMCKGGSSIYLAWTMYDGYSSSLFMRKYSLEGAELWAQAVEIVSPVANYDLPQELIYSEFDDTVLLSLIRCASATSLVLQKMNPDGQFLWGDGVLVDASMNSYYSAGSTFIRPDSLGGCYVAWTRYVEDYWHGDVYAQHCSASGNELWQAGGVLICDAIGAQPLATLSFNLDHIWAAWSAQAGATKGIWYQILNLAGVPALEPNGRMLSGGMNSLWTEGKMTLSRSSDMLLLWNDDRLGDGSSQIYLQGINIDGSVDFAPNGIPVVSYSFAPQYLTAAQVQPNDQTVVVWMESRYGQYDLFAQLLDPAGNRLWGDTGLRLTTLSEGWTGNTQITFSDGSFYIGWTHYEYSSEVMTGNVRMQKITNGIPQWGENGLNIINDSLPNDNRLFALEGRYLVYNRRIDSPDLYTDLYVLHFSQTNGSPETGWGTVGIPVAQDGGLTVYGRSFVGMKHTEGGILVLYKEQTPQLGTCLMAQKFSLSGQPLLEPTGHLLISPTNYISSMDISFGAEDFAVLWSETGETATNIFIKSVNYSMETLWGPLDLGPETLYTYFSDLARFPNNALAVLWHTSYYDPAIIEMESIRYIYITPQGEILGAAEPFSIPTNQTELYFLESAVLGNRALLTWYDGSSYWNWKDEPIEHSNLWAQMIGNETVSIDDPGEVPGLAAVLYPNYPNPFNPETTIRYQLKAPAKVELSIYNLKGQLIRTLLSAQTESGVHAEVWNGRNDKGQSVASGVYLYRLSIGKDSQTRKMVLMK